jgi:abequosyltransferase
MYKPLLSICIPTYQRAEFLYQLLLSLVGSDLDADKVQIVVSDNHSSDNTDEVIRSFRSRLEIKHIYNSRNTGPYQNIISTVSYADGTFAAIIGDDDVFVPGWISMLCELLLLHAPDIVVSDRILCDRNMVSLGVEVCGPIVSGPELFSFSKKTDLISYFNQVDTCCGLGYLSNIVVRVASWNAGPEDDSMRHHPFPHTIKLVDMLYRQSASILRVPMATVYARSGNERFEELGDEQEIAFKKLSQHIDGFMSIADMYFSRDRVLWEAFLTPIYKTFLPDFKHRYILSAKSARADMHASTVITRLGLN